MSHSQGTQRYVYKQYIGANKDTLIFWPEPILHDFGKKKSPKNYSNTHFSFFYSIYNLKCMEALETQVFFLYDKAFSLSIYFPCILFFFFGLMMASIEDHNIQPPYLLVNKLSQLTYTLMDFSEFYRNKEKHAT